MNENVKYMLIFLVGLAIIFILMLVIDKVAENKPHCYVCNEVLWAKDNQWQLWGIWACKSCFEDAYKLAKKDLGSEFYNPDLPGYVVEKALLRRTYEILKERRKER